MLVLECRQEPKETLNINASLEQSSGLTENPLLMIPLTSSINPKNSSMSTLYGNQVAADYAKQNADSKYPQDAVLYEVTWKQKADEFWFGANIPNEIYSVEKIVFNDHPEYGLYKGKFLQKEEVDSRIKASRIALIISQKMAVSP